MDYDICEFCTEPGELVICDRCEGTWHRKCHPIQITDEEMAEGVEWICHRCKRSANELPNPELTKTRHLLGCFNRNVPNVLAPRCRGKSANGKSCGHLASKQGCLWYEEGILYHWCPNHWVEYCIDQGFDADLSCCANRIASKKGYSLKEMNKINQFNLEEKLGLPLTYDSFEPSNHLSFKRQLSANNERKSQRMTDRDDFSEDDLSVINLVSSEEVPLRKRSVIFSNGVLRKRRRSIDLREEAPPQKRQRTEQMDQVYPQQRFRPNTFKGWFEFPHL